MNSTAATDGEYDLAVVGAGLAGGLIAMALAGRRPDLRLALIDGAERAGGNHVWSWFDSDIGPAGQALLAPIIAHRWPQGHEVRFPSYRRHLDTGYASITSDRLDGHLRALLGERLLLGHAAAHVRPDAVELMGGRVISARGVIDARGQTPSPGGPGEAAPPFSCGWQKFLGQTLLLARPHGLPHPLVMDATVDQREGYRFLYALPLDPRRIFVEDTYYADEPGIDEAVLSARINDYADRQGWTIEAVLHRETGALPVVKRGDFERLWPTDDPVARAGSRAGLFHPTTGYSLPIAVDFALALAAEPDLSGAALARRTRALAAAHWRRGGYYRLLDRMLFDAAPPEQRHRVFERFYRLPAPLIARFYAHRSTAADKLRILCGKPPVPIRAAMRALTGQKRA